ncbi:MAG TPA: hypothetical protein VL856_10010 [Acidimicrobiia bacterium]|nr:hypothetical protein [Acidimicrobiia bacterium]
MGGLRRVAVGVVVALVASALPTAVVNVVAAPAAHATTNPPPAHPGGPFPLSFGDQVNPDATTGRGILENPGDEDVYTFSVGPAGQRIYLQNLSDRHVSGYMRWNLRDAEGRSIADPNNMADVGPLYLRADTYTLTAGASKGFYAGTHQYTFKLWAVPDEQDFSLTPAAKGQGTIVQKDSPALNAGNLEAIGSQDVYTFTAPSNGLVLDRQYGWPSCGYCTVMIRDAAGHVLATHLMNNFRLPHLVAGASYTLSVQQQNPTDIGEYKFELWTMPDVNLSSNVALGTAKSGSLATFLSQDAYTYQLTANSKISIQTSVASCRAQYTLFAPNGANLYSFCSAGTTVLTVPVTGLYKVLVTPNGGATLPLAYTLTVASSTATPTVTLNQQVFSINPAAAKGSVAISNGVPAAGAGNIESSTAQDLYAINVTTPGQRLYFQYDNVTPAWVFNWQLKGPDGAVMTTENGSVFDNTLISDNEIVSFPDAGAYTLTMRAVGAPNMGTYSIKIWTVAAPDEYSLTLPAPKQVTRIPEDTVPPVPAVPGATAGTLDAIGSSDVYKFHVNAPGQRAYLKFVSATQNTFDWQLRGPDGDFVTSENGWDFNTWLHDLGDTTFQNAGDYLLTIFDPAANAGDYKLEIWGLAPAKAFDIAIGDTVDDGTLNGVTNSPTTDGIGRIETIGDLDTYTFHADAGELVYIENISNNNEAWDVRMVDGFRMPSEDSAYFFVHSEGGRYRMRRSGTYSIAVTKNLTGSVSGAYKFKLWHVDEPDPFDVALPFAVPSSSLGARAGNLETPGARDAYTFTGTAGEKIALNQNDPWLTHRGWQWELVDDNGFSIMPNPAADGSLPYLTVSSITLPRDGKYTLTVWDSTSRSPGGTYNFSVTVLSGLGTIPPLVVPDSAPMAIGDPITYAEPAFGAGALETTGAVDIYEFNAESGDAIVLDATATCPGNSARWNLRAPDGSVYLDRAMYECEVGPIVLPLTGTWLLTVGDSTGPLLYDIALTKAVSLDEPPRAGQESLPSKITRISPTSGAAGSTATVELFASHMTKVTDVHFTKSGVDLPVRIFDASAVNTSFEARALQVQVDLSGVTGGDYTITADLADGTQVQAPQLFHVGPAVTPRVNVSMDYRPMIGAAVNYAFVNVTNPTTADYYHGIFGITVPCDGSSVTRHGLPYATTVRLIQRVPDTNALADALQSNGVRADVVQGLRSYPWTQAVAPSPASDGTCGFLAYAPRVPSKGTVSFKLQINPPTPAPGVIGRLTSPITTHAYNQGTHLNPNAPDSALRMFLTEFHSDPNTISSTATRGLQRSIEMCADGSLPLDDLFALAGIAIGIATFAFGGEIIIGGELAAIGFDVGALGIHWGGLGCGHLPPEPTPCPKEGGEGAPPSSELRRAPSLQRTADTGGGSGCNPPVENGADPNAMSGPSTVNSGGTVRYTVDFENDDVGSTAKVDVLTNLDPNRFDLSSLKVTDVGVASESTGPLNGNAGLSSGALSVNGATVNVRSTLKANGDLDVDLAGEADQYGPYTRFLPQNTDAAQPAGQGYVTFEIDLLPSVPRGTQLSQTADVVFDGADSLTTNPVLTTVVDEHPMSGLSLTLTDKPLSPTSRKLSFKTKDTAIIGVDDPTVNGVSVTVRRNLPDGTTAVDTYSLPKGGWSKHSTKYVYKDKDRAAGPFLTASIDPVRGMVTLKAKGDQLTHSLATMPDTVDVVMIVNGYELCSHLGEPGAGIKVTSPTKKFLAKAAPAPGSCPGG